MANVISLLTKEEIETIFSNTLEKKLKQVFVKETEEKMLSREEAANFLCVSKGTLDNWVRVKLINSYKLGCKILFKRSELIQVINDNRVND